MSKLFPVLTLLSIIFLASCTTIAEHFPGVYAIDVQQGNIIDGNMIDQLRPNMNKRQVLYIMGSPMLIDIFHQKRWDYIYSEQVGGGDRLQKKISLFFSGDKLTGVQGDFKPSEFPVIKPSTETTVDVPKRPDDKTIFGAIANFFTFEDEPVKQTPAENTLPQEQIKAPEADISEQSNNVEAQNPDVVATPEIKSINEPSTDFQKENLNTAPSESQIAPTTKTLSEADKKIPQTETLTDSEPPLLSSETPLPDAVSGQAIVSEPAPQEESAIDTINKQLQNLEKPPLVINENIKSGE